MINIGEGNCRETSTRISSNATGSFMIFVGLDSSSLKRQGMTHPSSPSSWSCLITLKNIFSYPSQPFHKTCFHRNAYKFTPVTSCPTLSRTNPLHISHKTVAQVAIWKWSLNHSNLGIMDIAVLSPSALGQHPSHLRLLVCCFCNSKWHPNISHLQNWSVQSWNTPLMSQKNTIQISK